jgi:tripartite-type tricarboxylate transporter receptor subunit TctC
VLTIIVGYPAGGGYDLIARLLAKHLPKYIPGKPAIIIQNMPGASSMIAANHIYHRVKPDGLTLFATARNLVFMQLLKAEGVRYDMRKFSRHGMV